MGLRIRLGSYTARSSSKITLLTAADPSASTLGQSHRNSPSCCEAQCARTPRPLLSLKSQCCCLHPSRMDLCSACFPMSCSFLPEWLTFLTPHVCAIFLAMGNEFIVSTQDLQINKVEKSSSRRTVLIRC